MVKLIVQGFIIIVLLLGAFQCGRRLGDKPPETRVVYRDREITRYDTIRYEVAVPKTVYRYRRNVDTVNVCLTAPREFDIAGLVSPSPIRRSGSGDIIFTQFRTDSLFFEQQVFPYRIPRWGYLFDASVEVSTTGKQAGGSFHLIAGAQLRYRSLTLRAESRLGVLGESSVGIRLKYRLGGRP